MPVAFEQRMAGAFALSGDGDHLGRPLSLFLAARAPSLMHLLRTRNLEIRGELDAPGFADARPLCGTLHMGREARYELAFTDNSGRRCAFRARQELTLRRPPGGFSVLRGEIRVDDQHIGAARLRFDPRSEIRALLSSLTFRQRE